MEKPFTGRGELTGTIGKSLSKLSADFCVFTSEESHPHLKAVVWGLARGAEGQDKCVEVVCRYVGDYLLKSLSSAAQDL